MRVPRLRVARRVPTNLCSLQDLIIDLHWAHEPGEKLFPGLGDVQAMEASCMLARVLMHRCDRRAPEALREGTLTRRLMQRWLDLLHQAQALAVAWLEDRTPTCSPLVELYASPEKRNILTRVVLPWRLPTEADVALELMRK